MLKLMLFCSLAVCGFSIISGFGEKMLGPGKWFVHNIMKCADDAEMLFKVDVSRRKINRTHDGFNAKLNIEDPIDSTFGVVVDICKIVDGGCKPYQVLTDDSFERFCNKWSKENTERMFRMANIDPPCFPWPAGKFEIQNFVMDYDDLPQDGPYGDYEAEAYLMKDGLKKACVKLHADFTEKKEDD